MSTLQKVVFIGFVFVGMLSQVLAATVALPTSPTVSARESVLLERASAIAVTNGMQAVELLREKDISDASAALDFAVGNFLFQAEKLEEAEKAGVKIYRYQRGFLHQKVMLVDDHTATVGTANFDNRSMRLNFEVTMVVVDEEFAQQVERMLNTDFEASRQVFVSEFNDRSPFFQFSVRAARLLAPVQ